MIALRTTSLLAALICSAAFAAAAAPPTIVDLSVDFEESSSMDLSPGAALLRSLASSDPLVRNVLVLEDGKIVAEYIRADNGNAFDVDVNVPHPVWSTTKSFMSLAIGMMVQDGLVNVDETLGDIFLDEEVWSNEIISRDTVEFRKAVTLKELLSMTSGLVDPAFDNSTSLDPSMFSDGGTLGGASLPGALQNPDIAEKTFTYLAANNILSYVIQERAGTNPREYLAMNVFPSLGINNDEIGWWKNEDGLEYAYHGMLLTTRQMAKWGQLYLQNGKSNEDTQLVDQEWIETSSLAAQVGNYFYGYLIWIWSGALLQLPELGTISCAQGLGGQDVCFSPSTGRVIAQLRDFPAEGTAEADDGGEDAGFESLVMTATLMNQDIIFNTTGEDSITGGDLTGDSTVEDGASAIDEDTKAPSVTDLASASSPPLLSIATSISHVTLICFLGCLAML